MLEKEYKYLFSVRRRSQVWHECFTKTPICMWHPLSIVSFNPISKLKYTRCTFRDLSHTARDFKIYASTKLFLVRLHCCFYKNRIVQKKAIRYSTYKLTRKKPMIIIKPSVTSLRCRYYESTSLSYTATS